MGNMYVVVVLYRVIFIRG